MRRWDDLRTALDEATLLWALAGLTRDQACRLAARGNGVSTKALEHRWQCLGLGRSQRDRAAARVELVDGLAAFEACADVNGGV